MMVPIYIYIIYKLINIRLLLCLKAESGELRETTLVFCCVEPLEETPHETGAKGLDEPIYLLPAKSINPYI